MKNMARMMVVVVLLALGLVASNSGPSQAQSGAPVRVINTLSEPVPSKVVNATFESIPTIVNNGPGSPVPTVVNNEVLVNGMVALNPLGNGVKVLNNLTDAGYLRDRDNPAFQPFHRSLTLNIPDGVPNANDSSTLVPSGKRLVIETVSWQGLGPAGQVIRAIVQTRVNGEFGNHYVQANRIVTGGAIDWFVGTQALRAYGDPDTAASITVIRDINVGAVQANITISGYLVDVP